MDTGFQKVAGESTRIVETGFVNVRRENMWITRNRELRVLPVGVVYDFQQYGSDAAKIIRAPFFGK